MARQVLVLVLAICVSSALAAMPMLEKSWSTMLAQGHVVDHKVETSLFKAGEAYPITKTEYSRDETYLCGGRECGVRACEQHATCNIFLHHHTWRTFW